MKINRRNLLRTPLLTAPIFPILGQSAAQEDHAHAGHTEAGKQAKPWQNYTPRVFNSGEYRTLTLFCGQLLPEEKDSPGAVSVGVPYYIDTLLHYADQKVQRQWLDGLAALNAVSQARFRKAFAALPAKQQQAILTEISKNERSPTLPAEQFFAMAKQLVITAWAQSEDGMRRGLGYKGNQFVESFRGCD